MGTVDTNIFDESLKVPAFATEQNYFVTRYPLLTGEYKIYLVRNRLSFSAAYFRGNQLNEQGSMALVTSNFD
jgi:hypothetical protein